MVRFAIASFAICVALIGWSRPASGSQVLLLDFTSPHCGPCQQMAPTIEGLKNAGYAIRPVDTTRDLDTTRQYRVARVPMLVMLVDGEEFERVQGGMSGTELELMFQRANREAERRNQNRVRGQSQDNGANLQLVQQRRDGNASPYARPGSAGSIVAPGRSVAEVAPLSVNDSKLFSLVNSSVRLRVEDSAGHAFGTGTIIDARQGEALVVTCGHLFRQSKGTGPLTVEMFESTPGGVRSVGQVPGMVISYDLERDIALVAIRPGRPVAVAQVAPQQTAINVRDRVVSVGCSNGQDPTVLASRVTSLDRYQGPPNIEASGAPVEGRSGGGLFNEQGQLIGICFAADHEGNEGLYAALKVVHDELASRGLSDVFMKPISPGANAALLASAQATTSPRLRTQGPDSDALPSQRQDGAILAAQFAGPVAVNQNNATPAPATLTNPKEKAAWEEIMSRAATAEVICIIRPKQPGGQSEVITLDNMSPEFVQALAGLRKVPATISR